MKYKVKKGRMVIRAVVVVRGGGSESKVFGGLAAILRARERESETRGVRERERASFSTVFRSASV